MTFGFPALPAAKLVRWLAASGLSFLVAAGLLAAGGGTIVGVLGIVAVGAIIVPATIGVAGRTPAAVTAVAGCCCGVAAASRFETAMSVGDVFACVGVVGSIVIAEIGLARLARQLGCSETVATGLVVAGTFAWLTWPLWLRTAPPVMMEVHPLLALNGTLPTLGIWTELPVAYQVMVLGQDVSYGLPVTVWPTIGIHLVVGVVGATLAGRLSGDRIASRSTNQIDNEASAASIR